MEKQYIFFITTSGDRTNIMSDFKVVDKNAVIDYLNGKSYRSGMVR